MAGAPSKHMRVQKEPPSRMVSLPRIALLIAVSCLMAVLLEAGTVFGSFCLSVRNLSDWIPKRMLIFFALSLCICLLCFNKVKSPLERLAALRARVTVTRAGLGKGVVVATSLCAGYAAGLLLASCLGDPGDIRYAFAGSCVFGTGAIFALFWKALGRSLEWGFLVLALGFGSTFCFLMPTAAEISWDGQIHFNNANALSYVLNPEYTGADGIMTTAGDGVGALTAIEDAAPSEEFEVELGSRSVVFPHADLEDTKISLGNTALRSAEAHSEVARLLSTSTYPQGSYLSASTLGDLPTAAGLWTGRLLHLDCVSRYTLARLFNTWFYAVVFFFAIRALKNGKVIMAAIGLCPTTLIEAANFSYDPWSIGLLSLSMGLFVGCLQQERTLTPRDTIRCLVPFVLGALVRAIVFPLALVFALVPKHRFSSKKDWLLHLLLIALATALLLFSFAIPYLTSFTKGESKGDARGGSNVNAGQQLAYVAAHPLQTLKMSVVFAARMLNPLNLGMALEPSDENLMCYAPYLVFSHAPLTEILATVEYLLLVLVSFLDGGRQDESFSAPRYKVGALIGTGLSFALICGSMYAAFTAVGRDTIAGVHQRYLLGLLAAFFLLVCNIKLRRKGGRPWLVPVFLITEIACLSCVLWNSFVWAF